MERKRIMELLVHCRLLVIPFFYTFGHQLQDLSHRFATIYQTLGCGGPQLPMFGLGRLALTQNVGLLLGSPVRLFKGVIPGPRVTVVLVERYRPCEPFPGLVDLAFRCKKGSDRPNDVRVFRTPLDCQGRFGFLLDAWARHNVFGQQHSGIRTLLQGPSQKALGQLDIAGPTF